MSCDRYTAAIVDHACGAEIAADAAAHMRTCGICGRMFDEQRRLLQDLDEELQRALSIEPSARFVPDAMAGVERSALRSRKMMWWSASVAAAAALVLVAVGALRFGEVRHEPATLPTTSSAVAEDHATSSAATSAQAGGAPRLATAQRRSDGRSPSGLTSATASLPTSWFQPNGRWRSSVIWLSSGAARSIPQRSPTRRGLALPLRPTWLSRRSRLRRSSRQMEKVKSVPASIDADPDQDRERGV